MYGIRYTVSVGREMRSVTREKFFDSEKALDKFIAHLEKQDNFIEILATSKP
jgi:hypothetical protein